MPLPECERVCENEKRYETATELHVRRTHVAARLIAIAASADGHISAPTRIARAFDDYDKLAFERVLSKVIFQAAERIAVDAFAWEGQIACYARIAVLTNAIDKIAKELRKPIRCFENSERLTSLTQIRHRLLSQIFLARQEADKRECL
jgi:hypothetical protein